MKAPISKAFRGIAVGIAGLALLAFLGGCGSLDRAPLTSDSGTAVEQATPSSVLAFSPRALGVALAKRAGRGDKGNKLVTEQADDWFDPKRSGKLEVSFRDYTDQIQVDQASFRFAANSMETDGITEDGYGPERRGKYHVVMKVTSGTTLEDMLVEFSPDGMAFSPHAVLTVSITGDLSALAEAAEITVYHISADGTVTEAKAILLPNGNGLTIVVSVPGFSEYDWDDVPEAFIPQG